MCIEKICKTCINLCNKRGEVEGCDRYKGEVQEMIKEIDKLIKEGYQDWEGMR